MTRTNFDEAITVDGAIGWDGNSAFDIPFCPPYTAKLSVNVISSYFKICWLLAIRLSVAIRTLEVFLLLYNPSVLRSIAVR